MVRTDEERWTDWCSDFDEVEREVYTLFHTRWMWRAITGLMNNGVPNKQYTVVQNYFIRTYVATVCTAIRREADQAATTSSLARCLSALVECPHIATRRRWHGLALAHRDEAGSGMSDHEVGRGFDAFAPAGENHIDPIIAQAALERLTSKVGPIRKYTNKVLAHRDRHGRIARVEVSFDQINEAMDEVGRILQQFYRLRHPGSALGNVTPTTSLEWVSMFQVPWYSETWEPPADWDSL
ncbi:MAG: hypothetical protein ACJ74U_18990 [Jatrophihabitantaceae bacterium]